MASVLNTAVAAGAGLSVMTSATRDVFSAEIWFSAMPVLKWDQFSTKKTELGVQPGKTIILPRFNNVRRGGRLTEGTKMVTRSMSMSSASLSVEEQGNAIGFSEYLLQVSFFDQLSAASLLLGRDMALVLDAQLRDVAIGTANVLWARQKSSRVSLTRMDIFDTQLVKDAAETLQVANAPMWGGDHYIAFCHPHQLRGMRDDNDWVNAAQYAGSTQIYTGEVGRYEDVRFISTTMMPNGRNNAVDAATGDFADPGYNALLRSGTAGNQTHIYQSCFFGEYSFGHATALPVELRDNGVEDFGREHGIAWYAIWGQGLLEEANILVGETA